MRLQISISPKNNSLLAGFLWDGAQFLSAELELLKRKGQLLASLGVTISTRHAWEHRRDDPRTGHRATYDASGGIGALAYRELR